MTYYRSVAEDEENATVYTVSLIPGVRNKILSFEIATDKTELHQNLMETMGEVFDESSEIYSEIFQKHGLIHATIKELGSSSVDCFQTKWFGDPGTNSDRRTVYNLKSHIYDISVNLPVGYDYDVYLVAEEKDNSRLLPLSEGGYSGRSLVLSKAAAQRFHIRIVLKRADPCPWGVSCQWTPDTSVTDALGRVIVSGGGVFTDFV